MHKDTREEHFHGKSAHRNDICDARLTVDVPPLKGQFKTPCSPNPEIRKKYELQICAFKTCELQHPFNFIGSSVTYMKISPSITHLHVIPNP